MSIGRNTIYNLVGTAIPTVLALATVPAYLKLIGPDRYGVLAIAWLILGYFGVFDLGLGRATSQRISALRDASPDERATAFGTALVANLVVGLIGAAVLWPAAYYLFQNEMKVTPALRDETLAALPLLALAVPVATTMGVFSGAMMAREKFLLSNRISVTSTSLFQLLPLAAAWFVGPNMSLLLATSIAARLVGCLMYWRECNREFGGDAWRRFDRGQLRQLLSYGGWITVTSLVGPVIIMIDRFAIGAMLGSYWVTVYAVPMQITGRLANIPQALGNAMFPRLALAEGDEARKMIRDGMGVVFAVMTPIVAGGYVLMENGLDIWVGTKIGTAAAPVGRLLLLAVWMQSLGVIAWVRLQARGRPDILAFVQMGELVPFLIGLYFAIHGMGVVGAALAYFLRLLFDVTLLNHLATKRFEHGWAVLLGLAAFGAMELLLPHVPLGLAVRLPLAIAFAGLICIPAWIVAPDRLRTIVLGMLGRVLPRKAAA